MLRIRTASAVILGAGLLFTAPAMAQAAGTATTPNPIFFAEGVMNPGNPVDFFADCGTGKDGKSLTTATLTGPDGIKKTLTPAADRGYLFSFVDLPKSFTAKTATFNLSCPNGKTAAITLTAGVKASAPAGVPAKKATNKAQVAVKPTGAPRTGGEPVVTAAPAAPVQQQGPSAAVLALGGASLLALGGGAGLAAARTRRQRG